VEDAKGALRNESQPFYRHRVTGTPKVILQLALTALTAHRTGREPRSGSVYDLEISREARIPLGNIGLSGDRFPGEFANADLKVIRLDGGVGLCPRILAALLIPF
jgi:hypothetical protein